MARNVTSFLFLIAFLPSAAMARATQATTGTVQGEVKDSNGAAVTGAEVILSQALTKFQATAETDSAGAFKFPGVPFTHYKLRVQAPGFRPAEQIADVHSAVPTLVNFSLSVADVAEQITVTTGEPNIIEPDHTSVDTDLNVSLLSRQLGPAPSRGLEKMVESAPGIVTDDNGRLHARGSESNVQTVINGIPITDNLSAIFATSFDPRAVSHVEVITGGIPAEFGDKLGAIVNLNTKSGLNLPISGEISGNLGNFSTGDVSANFAGHVKNFGWFATFSGSTSHRYLDPPAVENFHNLGRTANNLTTIDYAPSPRDSLKLTLIFGGANFQVPNRLEQQLAGQDQNQRQRQHSEFVTWQHIFSPTVLGEFSFFNRSATAALTSNDRSAPVEAFQDRRLTNYGFIASVSYAGHGHTAKAGIQYTRTPIRENFTFFPTDSAAFTPVTDDQGNELPNPVLQFSAANPFRFRERKAGNRSSFYVQDRFSLFKNLTLDLGVRFDDYRLIVKDQEVSPRIGLAYFIPRTKTVLRVSYNRFFQPPPSENLLLASSLQAAQLSPLAVTSGGPGVKPVLPDKEHVFEGGIQQQLTRFARLSLSLYNKQIRNFTDKDQFFETGVIFPISIFAGRVTGFEARLDTSEWRGLWGFLSYANARAFGVTPIDGGLFLGESVDTLQNPGLRFPNDHDQRNSGQFQIHYTHSRSGWWASFGGRYDSGVPADVEPGTTLKQFVAAGFDPRVFNEIDFQRSRVKPRTIWSISTGIDLFQKERTTVSLAFDVQNLANKLFLYNFESIFSGTHIGPPRQWSGRLSLRFK